MPKDDEYYDLRKQKRQILISLILTLFIVVVVVIFPLSFAAYKFVENSLLNQIYHDNANYAGLFASYVNDELKHEDLDAVLRKINSNIDSFKISKKGYACIYDTEGRLLAHPNQKWVAQGLYVGDNKLFPPGKSYIRLIDLIKQKENYVGLYSSSLGQKQVAAFYYLRDVNLVIGIHQPYSEIQDRLAEIRNILFGFIASLIILIPFASMILMRKRIQPYYDSLEQAVTMRKKLEKKLRGYADRLEHTVEERTKKLKLSERKYRDLVENSNDAIFALNSRGRFTFLNRKMEEVTGYNAKELLGRHFGDILTPKSAERAIKNFNKAMKGEHIPVYEMEWLTKNGEKKIIEVSGSSVYRGSKIVGRQIIARDITEKKRLEEKLAQSEKLASIGKLAAGVAHEINNPLANISIYAELLQLDLKGNGSNNEKIGIIIEEARRASKIIKNLLEFSRQSHLEISEVDVNSLILKCISLFEQRFKAGKVKVTKQLATETPYLLGDADQLTQVFINMFNNALHAMPDGGRLKVESESTVSEILIRISDNGVGIEDRDKERIFDPFFTTKGIGDGAGLGLSVSLGIVQKHNGTIEVESEKGRGTTFIIRLPRGVGYEEDFDSRRRLENAESSIRNAD